MNVYSTRVVHVVQYVYMCVVCTNKSVFKLIIILTCSIHVEGTSL